MRVLVGVSTTEGLHKEVIRDVKTFKTVQLINQVHHLHIIADHGGEDKIIAIFKNWDFIVIEK